MDDMTEETERVLSLCAKGIVYGTDHPVFDPVKEVERFLRLDLTDDQKEQIVWKTAKRILILP